MNKNRKETMKTLQQKDHYTQFAVNHHLNTVVLLRYSLVNLTIIVLVQQKQIKSIGNFDLTGSSCEKRNLGHESRFQCAQCSEP